MTIYILFLEMTGISLVITCKIICVAPDAATSKAHGKTHSCRLAYSGTFGYPRKRPTEFLQKTYEPHIILTRT